MIREALCVRLGHYWIRQAFEDQSSYLACLYCGQPYTSAPGDGGGTPGRETQVPGPAPRTMMDLELRTYLAGPMSGIPDFNYPEFNAWAADLRLVGMDVVNPAENDGGSTDQSWDFYMRLALTQLLTCQQVALLPGWEASRGARLEHQVAVALDMRVVELPHPATPE